MWDAWDLAVDQCLNQMPEVLEKAERIEKEKAERERHNTGEKTDKPEAVELYHTGKRFSTFFEEQLTAFEVCMYCQHTQLTLGLQTAALTREPPHQLPIVLQVLCLLPSHQD
jgi:regulator-associated protein of mTOR